MAKARITLSRAIEGYFIAAHARRLSTHTLADYDNTFRRFEAYLERDPPISDLAPTTSPHAPCKRQSTQPSSLPVHRRQQAHDVKKPRARRLARGLFRVSD